jgi:two-component system phosphate regulon response regulator PhoB
MSTNRILIIEDDPSIRDLLQLLLESRGFTDLTLAETGETGLRYALEKTFDLVLLDLTLPGMDGLEVCRRMREIKQNARVPIIILTARDTESDVVVGLEMGAVDYITKPFNNQTLIARIRAQLRRTQELESAPKTGSGDGKTLESHGVCVDLTQHLVSVQGEPVSLTLTEFDLLVLLIRRPGRVWSRAEIVMELRGEELFEMDRTIDVQVANLRKKLGDCGNCVETVRGVGYRWKY